MKYSIATVCLSGTLRDKISAIAKAGFRGIEIFENDLINHSGSVRDIRRMVDEHGLEIVTYQPVRDFEGLPEPYRSKAFDRVKRKLDLIEELGTDLLMFCSSCSPHALGGIQRAADDFSELGEIAAKRNLRVCYEALAWGSHVNDYRDSWEIVRRANHPSVGICLDTFHIYSRGTELKTMLTIPSDRMFLVQVADAPLLAMDHLSWSRHYRCFPGQGELDMSEFMHNLRASGYDGPFSLEIFNDQFRSGSTLSTARDGYRSLVYLNQKSEANTAPLEAALPPAAPPQEIQFIEFAIEKSDREKLTRLTTGLGFSHIATHKYKAVELWRQNAINLVMNFEPDSFAQQYHLSHGISVCAIGLLCNSAESTLARATQLCFEHVYGDPESDAHGIAAIAGPGDSLIYLVDKNTQPAHWESEFTHHERAATEHYLDTVDHIATSMDYEEMLHSVLLYRSVFGMHSTPNVDVMDPRGLVQSQVMQTADHGVSLTLNSTKALRTVSSQILNTYSGAGVNHIAFSTDDIFKTAAFLKINDIATMNVPENYYDDLAARFSLTEVKIEKLKSFGILYDEDDNGQYYQLYTQLFERRFCFEIVQRRNYRGFGVPNAQIRMTMQSRELRESA